MSQAYPKVRVDAYDLDEASAEDARANTFFRFCRLNPVCLPDHATS
jgi:hypothetical protein